ncbi:hypothetical protein Hamer_G012872 [Homarus americanus]|uniref:Uncharacterized protein n=1 Tax=Homarus americanus TaxID=6706 RepID=A0A8J5JZM5_HOMAM|nr:hypothetical protein Hamer_G012872 [Homarus americanus]
MGSILPSLLHLSESFLTPKHQSESFPHSYTSQRVLPSLLHITEGPSLTPTPHSESFPHSYTSHRVKGLRINAKPDNGLGEKVGLISVGGRLVLVPNLKLLQPNHVEMDFYPSEAVKIIQYN